MTVEDLVTQSLQEIGVLQASQVPSAEDAALGFSKLNAMVDQMGAERLDIYTITRTTCTIVSGTRDYTVGLTGDFNVARPIYVDHINFQDTSQSQTTEYPLNLFTDDMWSVVPIKTLTSPLPAAAYYNPTFTTASPLGTVSFFPVPTSSTLQGVLYAPAAVSEFASLATTVSLPRGYREMLVTNLALWLCPAFEREPIGSLVKRAEKSKAIIKRSNIRLADLSVDPAVLGSSGAKTNMSLAFRNGNF